MIQRQKISGVYVVPSAKSALGWSLFNWKLVMDNFEISKHDRFRFDFLKNLDFEYGFDFYFSAYETLATHARGP